MHLIQISKKASVHLAETRIQNILQLKKSLECCKRVSVLTSSFKTEILSSISNNLSLDFVDGLLSSINDVISSEVDPSLGILGKRFLRGFAIKSGFNGLLDIARVTYRETMDDIFELVCEWSKLVGSPIKPIFNSSRGFVLNAPVQDLKKIKTSSLFIDIFVRKKLVVFTALDLIKLNDRIKESLNEIFLISDKILVDLIEIIRQKMFKLYMISESYALFDMLYSFATYNTLHKTTRPEFNEVIAVKNGVHPILLHRKGIEAVSNPIYCCEGLQFQIITGINQSGKSTYIQQAALLQIMSQIGSFVPADFASFRLIDKLFIHGLSHDNISLNTSTFLDEVQNISYVLGQVTGKSLVVIDELGRNTSFQDGLGLSIAICEELMNSGAFVFIATHMIEMAKYLSIYPNVVQFHLGAKIVSEEDNYKVTYSHSLKGGPLQLETYGIETAMIYGLDNDIIKVGRESLGMINAFIRNNELSNEQHRSILRNTIKFKFANDLVQFFKNSTLTEEEMVSYLVDLKKDLVENLLTVTGE